MLIKVKAKPRVKRRVCEGVKKDRVKLVAGETSKSKLFQVLGEEDQP